MRTLVNLHPVNEFRAFDEMFERLFGGPTASAPVVSTLPIDITERENVLLVRAAVPGIAPEELEIQVENNVLTIRGETKVDNAQENDRIYRREISYGSFSRSLRLPENLNLNEVTADFKNGMVTVSIPRVVEEKPQPRRIPVRVSEPQTAPEENA